MFNLLSLSVIRDDLAAGSDAVRFNPDALLLIIINATVLDASRNAPDASMYPRAEIEFNNASLKTSPEWKNASRLTEYETQFVPVRQFSPRLLARFTSNCVPRHSVEVVLAISAVFVRRCFSQPGGVKDGRSYRSRNNPRSSLLTRTIRSYNRDLTLLRNCFPSPRISPLLNSI